VPRSLRDTPEPGQSGPPRWRAATTEAIPRPVIDVVRLAEPDQSVKDGAERELGFAGRSGSWTGALVPGLIDQVSPHGVREFLGAGRPDRRGDPL